MSHEATFVHPTDHEQLMPNITVMGKKDHMPVAWAVNTVSVPDGTGVVEIKYYPYFGAYSYTRYLEYISEGRLSFRAEDLTPEEVKVVAETLKQSLENWKLHAFIMHDIQNNVYNRETFPLGFEPQVNPKHQKMLEEYSAWVIPFVDYFQAYADLGSALSVSY